MVRGEASSASMSLARTPWTTSSCSCRRASSGTARSACSTARRTRGGPAHPPRPRRPPSGSGRPAPPAPPPRPHPSPAAPPAAPARARLSAAVPPQPVVRLEAYRPPDWERVSGHPRPPRSSLTPLLRLSDTEAYVQGSRDGGPDGSRLEAFIQVGIAQAAQPHYLRVLALPGTNVHPLIRFALDTIAARTSAHRYDGLLGHRGEHGILAPVRTYEAPIDRQLEDEGFAEIATVTLLLKETVARIAEPALVPAVR